MLILGAEDEHSGVFDGVAAWPVDCAENPSAVTSANARSAHIHADLLWPAATESTGGPRTSTVTAIPRGYARMREKERAHARNGEHQGTHRNTMPFRQSPHPGSDDSEQHSFSNDEAE